MIRRPVARPISIMGTLTDLADKVATRLILMKNIRIQGTYVGSVAMFHAMNRAIALHRPQPVIDRSSAFQKATEALRYLGSGRHVGKVVIEV